MMRPKALFFQAIAALLLALPPCVDAQAPPWNAPSTTSPPSTLQKHYPLRMLSPTDAEKQLRSLLDPALSAQTEITADQTRPALHIRGSAAALATIDILLPKLDGIGDGVTVGTLPPADASAPTIVPVSAWQPTTASQLTPRSPGKPVGHYVPPQPTLLVNPMARSSNAHAAGAKPMHVINASEQRPASTSQHLSIPPLQTIAPAAAFTAHPGVIVPPTIARAAVPDVSPAHAPSVEEPSGPRVYRCRLHGLEAAELKIRQEFADRPDVYLVVKPEMPGLSSSAERIMRFCVLAPDTVQTRIGQSLQEAGILVADHGTQDIRERNGTVRKIPMRPAAAIPSPLPKLPPATQPLTHEVQHISTEKLRLTLQALFGKRLTPLENDALGRAGYRLETLREPKQAIQWRWTPQGLEIDGDRALAEQMLILLRQIDQPDPPQGRQRRFISISHTDPETVRQILETNLQKRTDNRPSSPVTPPVIRGQESANRHPLIRLVGYNMQDDGGMLGGDMGGGGFIDPNAPPGSEGLEVVPDFRYQMIPALDVIVIDATGAEVAKFENMIREIERLTQIAEAKIEVFYLKNVNCITIRWVIEDILAPIFRTKQGSVNIVPMVNPNAILLVGWGDAFAAMKDLLELLDQPVAEQDSMMRVVKLKHAPATAIAQTLRQAFPTIAVRGSGFAPRINIMADQRSNALIIQAGPNDFKEIERIIAELDVSHVGPKVRIQHFKLKNTLVGDLAQVLLDAISPGIQGNGGKIPMLELLTVDEHGRRIIESGVMSDVRVSRDVRNNTLIITAPEHCLPLLEQLVGLLDVPNATAYIKVFQVKNGDADSMITTLRSLIPTQIAGQVGPVLPGSREEDTLVPIRLATDKRTNSILVSCALGDWDMIQALLLSLDRPEEQARKVTVFQLKSSKADIVAVAINEYLRSKQDILIQTPGATSPYEQIEQAVIVIPEIISNSLIVSATPKYYEEIIAVIEDLDRQQPQVVIQVLIAEVTLGDMHEFGAEFGFQDSLLFDRNTFNNVAGATKKTTITDGGTTTVIEEPIMTNGTTQNPGWLFNENPSNSLANGVNTAALAGASSVGSQLLTNFATARTNADVGFGGMIFSANSDAISIMIRLLQETSRLEILSSPKIMALDNQAAFIHVGQEVPRINTINATTTGTSASTTLDKVGLLLMVQPRISADDRIIMQVAAIKSNVGSAAEGIPIGFANNGAEIRSPRINVMQTNTMISAGDNETVMLSGLITKEHQKINRKVPLLGDIPLVGKLFQYDFEKCRRSELLVILTPRIVRNKEDAERIKQIETARMNWCLPNVTSIYGDINAYDIISETPYVGDAPIIYPEAVSEELLVPLDQAVPRKAPMPQPKIPVPTLAPKSPSPSPPL